MTSGWRSDDATKERLFPTTHTHTHTLTSLALVCIDLLSRRRPLHVSLTLKETVVVWAGPVLSRDNPTCRCLDPVDLTFALLSFRVQHDHGWRADG